MVYGHVYLIFFVVDEKLNSPKGHENFIYVNSRGAREVYSIVDQTKKVRTKKKKKKRSTVQKFPQILVVVSKFLRFLSEEQIKKKGLRPKSLMKSGVSQQKLRKNRSCSRILGR